MINVQMDTQKMIWSWGASDVIQYHGVNRGTKLRNLLDPTHTSPDLSKSVGVHFISSDYAGQVLLTCFVVGWFAVGIKFGTRLIRSLCQPDPRLIGARSTRRPTSRRHTT